MKTAIGVVYEQKMHIRSIWGEVDPATFEFAIKVELNDGSKVKLTGGDMDLHWLFVKMNQNKVTAKIIIEVEP